MKVLGNYQQNGIYYPGKLSEVKGDKCTIHYDDGDIEKNVPTTRLCFMPTQTTKRLRREAWVLVFDEEYVCYNVGIVQSQQKGDVTVMMSGRTKTVSKQTVTVGELG